MTACTDDERRRVAERLRELSGKRDTQGFDCHLANAVRGHDFCETPCEECHGRLLDELADLIDPDCEDGRYEGLRTARPVDREALLRLADEMDEATCDNRGEMSVSIGDVWGWAECIREACGEVES